MKLLKVIIVVLLSLSLVACDEEINISLSDDSDDMYEVLNDNEPDFKKSEYTTKTYIKLSQLDDLGRTGEAKACLGKDLMPEENETRGSIGMVKPSGWHTVKYSEDLVENRYLYNRCHQIAWCLSSLNDDKRNLMTGTRMFNVEGMLPFETEVANYIKETNHHVLYCSTPEFKDDELVARSLHLEASSVEDDTIRINVRIYNKQDGITIDYATGNSYLNNESNDNEEEDITYVLNISSRKFHRTDCASVGEMKSHNRKTTTKSREELIEEGYEPCGACNP